MARLPRLAAAGQLHQVVQRGNNGEAIFLDDEDCATYLRMLREAATASRVAIHGYALTGCHAHLVATPDDALGLSRMMQALGRRYVGRFNRRHGRTGTLWEGRFRATVLEAKSYLLACLCFVELAPVREGLVRRPQDHPWSSAAHHLGLRIDPLVTDHPGYWGLGNTPFEREAAHAEILERALTSTELLQISQATMKGWALGSAPFLAGLEKQTARRVVVGTRGRPAKARKSA